MDAPTPHETRRPGDPAARRRWRDLRDWGRGFLAGFTEPARLARQRRRDNR